MALGIIFLHKFQGIHHSISLILKRSHLIVPAYQHVLGCFEAVLVFPANIKVTHMEIQCTYNILMRTHMKKCNTKRGGRCIKE